MSLTADARNTLLKLLDQLEQQVLAGYTIGHSDPNPAMLFVKVRSVLLALPVQLPTEVKRTLRIQVKTYEIPEFEQKKY